MSSRDDYWYGWGDGRRVDRILTDPLYVRRGDTYIPPSILLSPEAFLVRFPTFSALLSDPSFSIDYIQSELDSAQCDIQLGKWPPEIVESSVYLLLAHRLQLFFYQSADNAVRGVAAAKGNSDTSQRSAEVDFSQLSSTVYGVRLQNLRTTSQENGGFIV